MELSPGPSTSTHVSNKTDEEVYCKLCKKILQDEDMLRLIIRGQLSVISVHLHFHNGYAKIVSKYMSHFVAIPNYKGRAFRQRSADMNHWQTIETEGDIFTPFIERLSKVLNVDDYCINQILRHVLTTTDTLLLDFDLQKLMKISKERKNVIEGIINDIFWHPIDVLNRNNECMNWFRAVDEGRVVPLYTTHNVSLMEYMNCSHTILQSNKNTIRWYFLDMHGELESKSYKEFLKVRKTKDMKGKICESNKILLKEYQEWLEKCHMVYVFRYFSDNNYNSDGKYNSTHKKIIDLLENPFMQIKQQWPFIVQRHNSETSKYEYHLIYKDNVNPTKENFCELLVMLRNTLLEMDIDCIAMQSYNSLNLKKALKIIKYVFHNDNITVIVIHLEDRPFCFGKKLQVFKCK